MDIRSYNREAWNRAVEEGDTWSHPASPEIIAAARQGDWRVSLTPEKPIPRDWFPASLAGMEILCLASGGGQQGPVLAAAGAQVTVLDNSPAQLLQDQRVAEREGLGLRLVEGDMRDLSIFPHDSFDLIIQPVAHIFVPDVLPVWRECYRVLRKGGALLAGMLNPVLYIFDRFKMDDEGELIVRYRLPYSDLTSPSLAERKRTLEEGWPLEFSHSLEELIGGQLQAGFVLTGFYEDRDPRNPLDEYLPIFFATRAQKTG
jgi:SAM-dependent methyltransferase